MGLLGDDQALVHPFVIGELAMGNLREWEATVAALRMLARPLIASESELLRFIEAAGIPGSGIGFVDAHLLASCRLTPQVWLWTRDRRLGLKAQELGLFWSPA